MARISLSSINKPNHFIRHINFLGELTPVVSELDRNDATFEIVPGLADKRLISFLSTNYPAHYLRHQNFRLTLQMYSPPLGGTQDRLFVEDATFSMLPGNSDVSAVSFLSFNYPDRFIRHKEFHLFIDKLSQSDLFKQDTTFRIVPGFIPASPHL